MAYVGLLWFDNDEKPPLEAKIRRAVEFYQNKYGNTPTLCQVHPSQLNGLEQVGTLEVKGNRHIRPNHFWIGMNGGDKE